MFVEDMKGYVREDPDPNARPITVFDMVAAAAPEPVAELVTPVAELVTPPAAKVASTDGGKK